MEIVQRETERLNTLVTDFLNYARPKEPVRRPIRLRPLVEDTVEVFRRRSAGKVPDIQLELPDLQAELDADQLRQVLWNLLSNAADAAGGQGHVTVRAEMNGDRSGDLELSVQDDGPGVPPELRAKIFDPFFTTKEEGSGLGLAIVQRIAEAHGGTVEVREAAGGGSLFAVRVPGVPP
jgi:two-component system sensor histidine kinase PilS (NtrC family)